MASQSPLPIDIVIVLPSFKASNPPLCSPQLTPLAGLLLPGPAPLQAPAPAPPPHLNRGAGPGGGTGSTEAMDAAATGLAAAPALLAAEERRRQGEESTTQSGGRRGGRRWRSCRGRGREAEAGLPESAAIGARIRFAPRLSPPPGRPRDASMASIRPAGGSRGERLKGRPEAAAAARLGPSANGPPRRDERNRACGVRPEP